MAQDKEAELEQQFEKLQTVAANDQHQKALKIADAILKLAPGDADALKCKAIAHMQLGDFAEAHKVLNTKQLADALPFERAYCLYRLQKFQEALRLLEGLPEEQAAAGLELQAQLHYRLGNSQQCIQAYEALMQQRKVSNLELKVNVLAAYVSASLAAQLPSLMASLKVTPKQSYEVGYNRACGLVQEGQLAEAEAALRVAMKQGEEALYEEDFTEEEVLDELAPLAVQLAYVLGRLGRPQEAMAKLEPLVNGQLSDEAAAAMAANNAFVEGFAADGLQRGLVSRSLKKLDALVDKSSTGDPLRLLPVLEGRLAAQQKQAIHLNRALLAMTAGRAEQARELAAALVKAYPSEPLVVLLQAALLAREAKVADADKLLSSLLAASPGSSADGASAPAALYPALLRVQLALESGEAAKALSVLQSLDRDMQMRPGVLATCVALHEQLGNVAAAESLLETGLAHWQRQQQAAPRGAGYEASEGVGWCLQRLVTLKLAAGKPAEATKLYQQLPPGGAGDANGPAVLAKLARAAAATGDAASIAALSKDVPGAAEGPRGAKIVGGYDMDALEGFAKAVTKRREDRKRDAEEAAEQQPKAKKAKKKRKPRYPKGYDPALPNGGLPPPDPERWLPKWQRSDAKKKATKRQRERAEQTVKGSQGAGKVNEALDRAKVVESDKGSPSKPALPQRPKGKGRR